VVPQSSCTSASTASPGVANLPSIPDQQRCEECELAVAAAGEYQPPSKPGVAMSLLGLLQAAVSLPGSAAAGLPAAPEFCDLRQAAHDMCGPTPRSHSISSDASSLLVSEASQQLRPAAVLPASSLQHGCWPPVAAEAGGKRASGTASKACGAHSRRGSSAQSEAASQVTMKAARSTSLPVPGRNVPGSLSPGGGAGHGSTPVRTMSKGRTSASQGTRVQPIP
jgi:hypothetical protein